MIILRGVLNSAAALAASLVLAMRFADRNNSIRGDRGTTLKRAPARLAGEFTFAPARPNFKQTIGPLASALPLDRSDKVTVIYFVSLFPALSETFIVREVMGLIRLGADVRIVSLKHARKNTIVQSDATFLLDRVIYPSAGWSASLNALSECGVRPVLLARELLSLAAALWRQPYDLAKSLVALWRALTLLPQLRRLGADHLHAHWATFPSTVAMFMSRRLHLEFSFTAHAHDIFCNDHLLTAKLERAAFGVTISEFNRRYLEQYFGGAAQSIRVIRCGVDVKKIQVKLEGREAGLIVAVGRLDEIKGFRHLIDACAILTAKKVQYQCLLIGEGELYADLKRRISLGNLGDRIHMLGALKHETVLMHLSRANVVVLPSVATGRGNMDGIPVALMEAMATGAPVVSTFVSGIPELVADDVSGLLVVPGDPHELAVALLRIFRSPALAHRLGERARKTVEEEFDASREAKKLYEAISLTIAGAQAASSARSFALTGRWRASADRANIS